MGISIFICFSFSVAHPLEEQPELFCWAGGFSDPLTPTPGTTDALLFNSKMDLFNHSKVLSVYNDMSRIKMSQSVIQHLLFAMTNSIMAHVWLQGGGTATCPGSES